MRKFTLLFSALFLTMFSFTAFAQDAGTLPVVSNADFVQLLLAAIGGLKGLSALAVAGVVTQLVVKFLSTELMSKVWMQIPGIWKLVTIGTLTAASSVIGMMVNGSSLVAALLSSTVLSSLMVLANEIYKHLTEPKPPVAPPVQQ